MKKASVVRPPAVFIFFFVVLFFVFSFWPVCKSSYSPLFSETLDRFQSDFHTSSDRDALISGIVSKKNRFAAFGAYVRVPQGVYRAVFYFESESPQPAEVELQVAADKGKTILASSEETLSSFPWKKEMLFKVRQEREIEPRVLHLSGNQTVLVEKVVLNKTKDIIPWVKILTQALFYSVLITFIFLSVFHTFKGSRRWACYLTAFFLILGCFMILRKAWVSEDAFIMLRYADNFMDGLGPVFNAQERVEGYTHPLWLAVVSFFRWLGLSAKGSVIVPGLLASFSALYILFFKIRFSKGADSAPGLNPGAVVLIGTSAFIDFGTSGLETALSYLLLVVYAKFLAEDRWRNQPAAMGLVAAFLVLTRPDFGLFLIFLLGLYAYEVFLRRIQFRQVLQFLAFPFVLVGGWQVFRMGYYAAFFPNPVYTKSGAGAYFSQGIKYLADLFQGSLLWLVLILAVSAVLLNIRSGSWKSRALIFFSGLVHGFFVIRGGGDFMHGRYLLPAFVLFAASMAGAFDRFFQKKVFYKNAYIAASLFLFYLSFQTLPVQLKGQYYHHGISNERYAYYKDQLVPLKYLFTDTVIFMWKTIGKNYNALARQSGMDIRVAYKNVGYTGYYAGKDVVVIDKLGLTDPVISRVALQQRERPGHEKHAPLGYMILRRLTFADTPFRVWNETAATKYGVLWDLSPEALNKLSFMLPEGFKSRIDRDVAEFLAGLDDREIKVQADFLFFLMKHWYPHTSRENQQLFRRVYREDIVSRYSTSYQWIEENRDKVNDLFSHVHGPLNMHQFMDNIFFALTTGRTLEFPDQRFMTAQ
ncbi:MAG: hypothetical protein R6V02_03885 [Candidatus Aminicenantes bacterium]